MNYRPANPSDPIPLRLGRITQSCNKIRVGSPVCTTFISPSPPIISTLRHFCSDLFLFGPYDVVLHVTIYKRESTHRSILNKTLQHCERQRKVHTRLCGSSDVVEPGSSVFSSRSVCLLSDLSLVHLPRLWICESFFFLNTKVLTRSDAPHNDNNFKRSFLLLLLLLLKETCNLLRVDAA